MMGISIAVVSKQTKMYREDDKIMLLATGEVLTVIADLSEFFERGIVVKENIGRQLMHSEVRPAGQTREREEARKGITEPDPFPPPLDNIF